MKQMSLFSDAIDTSDETLTRLLHDIVVIFRDTNTKLREKAYDKFRKFRYRYFHEGNLTLQNTRELIRFAKVFRGLSGPYRKLIEQEVLDILHYIVSENFRDENLNRVSLAANLKDIEKVADSEIKQRLIFIKEIVDFIRDTLQYKRDRDSLSGSRKAMALKLAAHILNEIDLPELLEMMLQALHSNSTIEISAALDVMNEYYIVYENKFNKNNAVNALFDLANRTRDRNILNDVCMILCRMGRMTEEQAVDRLDSL